MDEWPAFREVRGKRCCVATLAACLTLVLGADPVSALPPGRAWTPVAKLGLPGFDYMAGPLLDTPATGTPWLAANARSFSGLKDAAGFSWTDSTWTEAWRLGYGTGFLRPVLSPPDRRFIIWAGIQQTRPNQLPLVLAEVAGAVVVVDTVTHIASGTTFYAAAVGASRRWVVTDDDDGARVLYSDSPGVWHDIVAPLGAGYAGVAITTLDDTRALVAWPTNQGMGWGIAGGTAWNFGGYIPQSGFDSSPLFRPRPSGGHWLAWGNYGSTLGLASYAEGNWAGPESLLCDFADPSSIYYTDAPDLSRDGAELPAVAWNYYDGSTGATGICVCVPSEAGFGAGQRLAGSSQGILPTVARDRNGDVWVAWWKRYDGIFWTHTYTTATAAGLRVTGVPRTRMVSWTLSGPAPETWWAVLRAAGSGPYEVVARVRAGPSQEMSWTDAPPPPGAARYRIRRECVDTRHRWESEEASWPAKVKPTPLAVRVQNPAVDGGELSLTGAAAGPVQVWLYDLQGRRVMRATFMASGSGEDTLRLDWSAASPRPSPGIYLLRVMDAEGHTSEPVKLVILR
jgi:hypothetical protein